MLILYVKNILSRLYGTWLLRKQGHSVYQQTHSTFNSQHSRRYIDHRTVGTRTLHNAHSVASRVQLQVAAHRIAIVRSSLFWPRFNGARTRSAAGLRPVIPNETAGPGGPSS